MNSIRCILLAVAMGAATAGCGDNGLPLPEPDQTNICETSSHAIAENCKVGQKIAFLPAQFGNAQLPVYFAAANCDLRYAVVLTNGAVTCIFKPIKLPADPQEPPAPASQAGAR